MSNVLNVIRGLYKINKTQPKSINEIFNQVKSVYKIGDYKEFYNDKSESMFDIVFNEYDLYRVHLSVLEPGLIEKSNLSRQICLLEGKLFIEDRFCNINLNEGCYLSNTPNYIENKQNNYCVVISHVDIKNNLQDLPLL